MTESKLVTTMLGEDAVTEVSWSPALIPKTPIALEHMTMPYIAGYFDANAVVFLINKNRPVPSVRLTVICKSTKMREAFMDLAPNAACDGPKIWWSKRASVDRVIKSVIQHSFFNRRLYTHTLHYLTVQERYNLLRNERTNYVNRTEVNKVLEEMSIKLRELAATIERVSNREANL